MKSIFVILSLLMMSSAHAENEGAMLEQCVREALFMKDVQISKAIDQTVENVMADQLGLVADEDRSALVAGMKNPLPGPAREAAMVGVDECFKQIFFLDILNAQMQSEDPNDKALAIEFYNVYVTMLSQTGSAEVVLSYVNAIFEEPSWGALVEANDVGGEYAAALEITRAKLRLIFRTEAQNKAIAAYLQNSPDYAIPASWVLSKMANGGL